MTYMANRTAAWFVVLGTGIFAYVLHNAMMQHGHLPRWAPVPVGICILTLALGLWQALISQERIQIQREVAAQAESIKTQIRDTYTFRTKELERMARRWEIQGGTPRREWAADAARHVADHPGYQAIEWVDASYLVRWIMPMAGNEAAFNLDLGMETKRRIALERGRRGHRTVMTDPMELVQGGKDS